MERPPVLREQPGERRQDRGPRPLQLSPTRAGAGDPNAITVACFFLPQIRHDGDSFRLKVYDVNHKQVAELDVPHVTPPAPAWQPGEAAARQAGGRSAGDRAERDGAFQPVAQ